MSDLDQWEDYSELHDLESDSNFVESFVPGNNFVDITSDFGEPEHVKNCKELAIQGGFSYSDDQTALIYDLDVESFGSAGFRNRRRFRR